MITDPVEAREALSVLGTKLEYLREAIRGGEAGFRTATDNHPPGTGSQRAYQERVRVLRETHLPLGWERHTVHNLAFVVNPVTSVAIGTMLGDHLTGVSGPRLAPRNAHPRGKAGRALIESGVPQGQLSLLDELTEPMELPEEPRRIWYLLVHREVRGETIEYRSELSRPKDVDGEYIVSWHERILLPPLRMDPVDVEREHRPPEPEIDIAIAER